MKTITVITSLSLGLVSTFGQLTGDQSDYEPFSDSTGSGGTSYAVGQALAPNSPTLSQSTLASETVGGSVGVGTPSWWHYTNTASTMTTKPTIVAGDLNYPGLASTGGGRSAQFYGTGASALMNVTTDTGAVGYTAGTVFYSFALKLTDVSSLPTSQAAADLIFGITKIESYKNATATPTSVGAQLWIRSDGATGFQLGIEAGANANNVTASPTYSTMSYDVNDALFVVGEYDFSTKTASLFINPAPDGAQPAADVSDTQSGTGIARAASLTVFGDNGGVGSSNIPITGQMDDLRFGLTWASVTPAVPEPSALAFGALGLAALGQRRLRPKSF
jgi:hypothetical protein